MHGLPAIGLAISLIACKSADSSPSGTLTCRDDRARAFEVAVPAGKLSETIDHAQRVAKLRDCKFEAADPDRLPRPPAREVVIAPVPPPPPPPSPPQDDVDDLVGVLRGGSLPQVTRNVPPSLLEGLRIAGDKNILPDPDTKLEIQRSGKDKIVGAYKLCITVDGEVEKVSQLKATGFSAYDGKIIGEMKTWRYRPYQQSGIAIPVCTAVTFIYSVK